MLYLIVFQGEWFNSLSVDCSSVLLLIEVQQEASECLNRQQDPRQ